MSAGPIRVDQVSLGRLGSLICMCTLPDGRPAYYKVGTGIAQIDIEAESDRLRWLEGKLNVPRILSAGRSPEQSWILITAMPGSPARVFPASKERVIDRVAEGLKQIHALATTCCPFAAALDNELEECLRRIRFHELSNEAFARATGGLTPSLAIEELFRKRPLVKDLAFTHGDYGLSNVLLEGPQTVAFVDWGIAGLSDPHRDLMTISDSIRRHLGQGYEERLYQAYGCIDINDELLRYFTLLDQFFVPPIWLPRPHYQR